MWPLFWIVGALVIFLAAGAVAHSARERAKKQPVRGTACGQLLGSLGFLVALFSSLASLSLVSFGSSLTSVSGGATGGRTWALPGLLVWLLVLLLCAVAIPIRMVWGLDEHRSFRRILASASRFFVLPIGAVTARIARRIMGRVASSLEESYEMELCAVLAGDPSENLMGEPLAYVVGEFARTTAEDIMVPRSAIAAVSSSTTLAECVDVFAVRSFSRLPVYEGDLESVIGIVHVMDLLRESDLTKTVSQIVRPVPMVPESKRCDELLKEFQKTHGYMAIVLDEYGGTAGLVTVEDVLEELVGELGHEPLSSRRIVHKTEGGCFLVHAQTEIAKLESATGLRVPRGDYETLAGYLLQEFGRIPEVGASLQREGVLYEIADADSRKIKLVRVDPRVRKKSEVSGSTDSAGALVGD